MCEMGFRQTSQACRQSLKEYERIAKRRLVCGHQKVCLKFNGTMKARPLLWANSPCLPGFCK